MALGKKKIWILWVDYMSEYSISRFVASNEIAEESVLICKKLLSIGTNFKFIRCKNPGENRQTQKALEQEEFNISFQ